MPRVAKRGRGGRAASPHAHYGVNLSDMPETYVPPEPFVAYRAWNWTEEGITSLNRCVWTPKQAFEATCAQHEDRRSMLAACTTPATRAFWKRQQHLVPDPKCTCGMYAGINMQHLIYIKYVQRGIHGEVYLWGRLYKHTLGWRAQYAYPKNFVVPANMIPFNAGEAQKRLRTLTEFEVEIRLQPEREAHIGQTTIPLWVPDYGYSNQGIEWLVERWKKLDATRIGHAPLAKGDRLAVFSGVNDGGIGVVTEIDGGDVYYTMFASNIVYHKKVKDVVWNDRNWRWETTGQSSAIPSCHNDPG